YVRQRAPRHVLVIRTGERGLRSLLRGPLTSLSGRVAEEAEKARIRRQQHTRVASVQAILIGLHGSIEREEIRVTTIGLGIDAVALGIALAARLLALRLRLRDQHGHV